MKLISLKGELDLPLAGGRTIRIGKGKYYIYEERFVEELKLIYGEAIVDEELIFDNYIKPYKDQDLSNKTFFCFRSAGIGDLLAMMVPIRILKDKYPTCKFIIGSSEIYRSLFENDPCVHEFVPLPYPIEYLDKADYSMYFQGLVENYSEESTALNIYDLFLRSFSFDEKKIDKIQRLPEVFLNEEVDYDIGITFEGLGLQQENGLVAGIQLRTSTVVRDYPIELFKEIIKKLNAQNIRTVIIGEPEINWIVNKYELCDEKMSFNFIQHCITLNHLLSIVNHCDFIIGPDTSGLHIAGALRKPMIGLFGPIPSSLRIGYFKNAVGLDGVTRCHPCFLHGSRPCKHSLNDQYSPCLWMIDSDKVMESVNNDILPIFGKGITKPITSGIAKTNKDERRAVVTLVIGDEAKKMFEVCESNLQSYAKKVNAELIPIMVEEIKGKYPNLEKFQIASYLSGSTGVLSELGTNHEIGYDRILYVDVDVLINPDCPDLFNLVPEDSIGIVADNYDGIWGNLNRFDEIMNIQRALGFVNWSSGYFNSGVMVLSKHHVGLFSNPELREKYDSQFKDQTLLNYNAQKFKYKIFPLDKKFNGMEINSYSSRSIPPNKTDAMILHFAHESDDRAERMKETLKLLEV